MKTILVDALHAFVIKGEGIFKPMFDLLERYANKKIILTNANDEEAEKFGLNEMPYEVFTLKHNPEKTDPRYYETMLKRFDLQASDAVYFEHNEAAVESARSVGITTYHYDPIKKELSALDTFLKENL